MPKPAPTFTDQLAQRIIANLKARGIDVFSPTLKPRQPDHVALIPARRKRRRKAELDRELASRLAPRLRAHGLNARIIGHGTVIRITLSKVEQARALLAKLERR